MMGTSLKLLSASDFMNECVIVRPSTIARACQCMPPRPSSQVSELQHNIIFRTTNLDVSACM